MHSFEDRKHSETKETSNNSINANDDSNSKYNNENKFIPVPFAWAFPVEVKLELPW